MRLRLRKRPTDGRSPVCDRFVNAQYREKVERPAIPSSTSHPMYAIDVYTTLA
jgi:hypothetical protein